MSTATTKRKDTSEGSRSSSPSTSSTWANLPPSRQTKMLKPVSAPLGSTRLYRFIYILLFLTSILCAFYTYRIVQHKKEVGGWWNLALGTTPPQFHQERKPKYDSQGESVEDKINALARALGMPSKDLAVAIAGAVRQYVPPASLSSVAAKESGPVVEALVKGRASEASESTGEPSGTGTAGVVSGVLGGIENLVGMDEP